MGFIKKIKKSVKDPFDKDSAWTITKGGLGAWGDDDQYKPGYIKDKVDSQSGLAKIEGKLDDKFNLGLDKYGATGLYANLGAAAHDKPGDPKGGIKDYALSQLGNIAKGAPVGDMGGFDPDAFLSGGMTPQANMGWLGFENTPIGKLYGTTFEKSPGYQFQLDEANKAANQALAAQGLTNSGAQLKELQRLAQGHAAQSYGNWQANVANQFQNYLQGLRGMAGAGQQAAAGGASAVGGLGANQANLAAQAGMLGAQGDVSKANIMGGALGQLANIWGQYQGSQTPPPQADYGYGPQGAATMSNYSMPNNQYMGDVNLNNMEMFT